MPYRPFSYTFGMLISSTLISLGIPKAFANSQLDMSLVDATPHEIALTQVLSEICPPMLTPTQKNQFAKAYQMQLKVFMPTLDTTLVMQQFSAQKEYKIILNSIRQWTLSYPKEENKQLCIEFAEGYFS